MAKNNLKINQEEIINLTISELNNKNFSKKEVTEVLKKFFDIVVTKVGEGEKVSISNFGIFQNKKRKARKVRNIQTGQQIDVAEKNVPKFTASKAFKESLNA